MAPEPGRTRPRAEPEEEMIPSDSGNARSGRDWAWASAAALLFSFLSAAGLNPCQFGQGDQAITVPFVKSYAQPELYPGDDLIAEKNHLYTILWPLLGQVSRALRLDLPPLFFLLRMVFLCASFFSFYTLSLELFKHHGAAVLALFFFCFPVYTLGGVPVMDAGLTTRLAALPFLIFSLRCCLRKKFILCSFLQGLGFLIHPLSAIFVTAMTAVFAVFSFKEFGWKKILGGLLVLPAVVSPLLAWMILQAPAGASWFRADEEWLALLRTRSSHHVFPFSWPPRMYMGAVLVIGSFVLSWKHRPVPFQHRFFQCALGVFLFFCLLGTLFTECIPLPLAIQLQLFRASKFIHCFTALYYAHFCARELEKNKGFFHMALAALPAVSLFFVSSARIQAWAAFGGCLLALWLWRCRARRNPSPQHYLMAGALPLLIFSVLSQHFHSLSIGSSQDRYWREIQWWANENTPADALFIVPPYLSGFRVESERAVYGEWKDGTQMFFNPVFGKSWWSRMERLGAKPGRPMAESFRLIREDGFLKTAAPFLAEGRRVFLAAPLRMRNLSFPVVFQNGKYAVFEILKPAARAEPGS